MPDLLSKHFITLLKLGLWGRKEEDLSAFALNSEEWERIYKIAKAQTVEGIVFEGILTLPQLLFPPMSLVLRWTARVDAIERYNQGMMSAMFDVVNLMKSNNIDVVLLKGFSLGANYDKPLLRRSGDVDFFIESKKDFDRATALLKDKGVVVEDGDHGSIAYKVRGHEFEHHTQMIDIFNPFLKKKINQIIEDEKQHYSAFVKEKGSVAVPSYLITQLQANAHILKHFLGFGIGLRQFCDIARLTYAKPVDFDGNRLKELFEVMKIAKWMDLVYSFLIKELGMDVKYAPYQLNYDQDTSWLLEEILRVGNFGFYDDRSTTGSGVEKREENRSNAIGRVVPHVLRTFRYSPSEAFWYPIMKVCTKLFNR